MHIYLMLILSVSRGIIQNVINTINTKIRKHMFQFIVIPLNILHFPIAIDRHYMNKAFSSYNIITYDTFTLMSILCYCMFAITCITIYSLRLDNHTVRSRFKRMIPIGVLSNCGNEDVISASEISRIQQNYKWNRINCSIYNNSNSNICYNNNINNNSKQKVAYIHQRYSLPATVFTDETEVYPTFNTHLPQVYLNMVQQNHHNRRYCHHPNQRKSIHKNINKKKIVLSSATPSSATPSSCSSSSSASPCSKYCNNVKCCSPMYVSLDVSQLLKEDMKMNMLTDEAMDMNIVNAPKQPNINGVNGKQKANAIHSGRLCNMYSLSTISKSN